MVFYKYEQNELSPLTDFSEVCVAQYLDFCEVFCGSSFVLLDFVLSVLWFMASSYFSFNALKTKKKKTKTHDVGNPGPGLG